MARSWKAIAGLAVTGLFLWLLLRGINFAELADAFAHLSVSFLVTALAFLAAGYTLRIIRWWWMLRALEPSLRWTACIWPFLTSIAVNNVMPFRAGDALRVFGFRRQLRSPVVRVLGTLVIERILDLVAVLVFFFVGLLGLPHGAFAEGFVVGAIWLAGIGIAALLLLVVAKPWLESILRWIADHPLISRRDLSAAVMDHGRQFVDALGLVRSPSRLSGLLLISLLIWTFEGAVFATVAVALHAGSAPLGPWFAMSTGTLATLIPSSPGYVGTFDYFTAQGMEAYGVLPEISIAFALTVHAVLWVPLTAAGLAYLFFRGIRFRSLQANQPSSPGKE